LSAPGSALAVTQVWSSRERDADIEVGADWWLRVLVNGKEYFNSDTGGYGVLFAHRATIHLKQGWNDVTCVVGAGSNGHCFWFRMTNPGDLVVTQQAVAPAAPPANLPPVADLIPDNVPKGFSFYTDDLQIGDDPYAFIPW
jgi:hypothetical protein